MAASTIEIRTSVIDSKNNRSAVFAHNVWRHLPRTQPDEFQTIFLATPEDLIADLAPLEGTPPDIAKGLAFNAPLIDGPPPEGGCNLEDAGRFGTDFFIVFFF
jgi:hypothetical protein